MRAMGFEVELMKTAILLHVKDDALLLGENELAVQGKKAVEGDSIINRPIINIRVRESSSRSSSDTPARSAAAPPPEFQHQPHMGWID
ncbi:hypothetical protein SADUNF_Sadunf16G0005000 [Salix dunnii]|uniref:Uncharacterized protein n=1 Tax=Salix dunnii TaxID=1413687 RepID=A0A835MFM5_9ROSI|nr:hypothetical protein SADUNF_Sadunf16G0005000 [Salix dunnii]